jgi:hypothetical protein
VSMGESYLDSTVCLPLPLSSSCSLG